MKKTYSSELHKRVCSQIPQDILEALSRNGWNVFGIYEVVKRELRQGCRTKSEEQLRRIYDATRPEIRDIVLKSIQEHLDWIHNESTVGSEKRA